MSLIDGISPAGARVAGVPLEVRGFDHGSIHTRDMHLDLNPIEDGKWLLQVNGVKMIFDRRPDFYIPPES